MSIKHVITAEINRLKALYNEDRNMQKSHKYEKTENQIHDIKSEYENKPSQEEQRQIFYKYANLYKTNIPEDIKKEQDAYKEQEDKEKDKAWEKWKEKCGNKIKSEENERIKFESQEEKKKNVEREWYVYSKLHEKGLENTNIEKLLDLTVQDIQQQYSMKQDTENKIGFITALWGVTVSAVITANLPARLIEIACSNGLDMLYRIFSIAVLIGLGITGSLSLILIGKAMLTGQYGKYLFDKKEINFKCAVDDKYMSLTRLLDGNTTVWERNEKINNKKYKTLRKLMVTIGIFMAFIIISYSVCVISEKYQPDIQTKQQYTFEEENIINEEDMEKVNR